MTVTEARERYLRWGAAEREHAASCSSRARVDWRCWTFLGRRVEAASVALDMALAAESDQRIRRAVAW